MVAVRPSPKGGDTFPQDSPTHLASCNPFRCLPQSGQRFFRGQMLKSGEGFFGRMTVSHQSCSYGQGVEGNAGHEQVILTKLNRFHPTGYNRKAVGRRGNGARGAEEGARAKNDGFL